MQYTLLTSESWEDCTDTYVHAGRSDRAHDLLAPEQKNLGPRRRMATCEELEKVTRFGKVSLHDSRKNLVVISRLKDYGLI